MASKLLYGTLGFLTGPIGGAVGGYYYTKKANEAQAAEGLPQTHSMLVNVLVGILLAPFSSAYYCYQAAAEENKLQEIQASQLVSRTTSPSPQHDAGINPEQTQSRWQDRINAERQATQSQEASAAR